MTASRWGALAVLVGALVFAVQGGEYGTFDLLRLRREERAIREQVAELQRTVDSLAQVARAIEQDPVTQERIARESFGMIRRGEFLYRFVPSGAGHEARREAEARAD